MPDQRPQENKFDQLRSQAEEVLRQRPEDFSHYRDILNLIQELKVHQAELEIQNTELKRSQQELDALHREYENLYEFAPCGYVTLNPKGIIAQINATGVSLLRVFRNRLKVTSLGRFIARESRQDYFSGLKEAAETGEIISQELKLIRGDVSFLWVQMEIQADFSGKGELQQWRLTLVDISRRKQAEENLRRNRRLLDDAEKLAGVGGWHWDPGTNSLTVSDNWLAIHGCKNRPQRIEELFAIVHPEDLPFVKLGFDHALRVSGRYNLVHRILRPDNGELRHIQSFGEVDQAAAEKGGVMFGASQDVTEDKKARQVLENSKKAADAASRAKSEFVANMSHEIRTPLNSVKGMIELALKRSNQPELNEYLDLAMQSADHLMVIINDIIDISRIDARRERLFPSPFSLRKCLKAIFYPLKKSAEHKGLAFELEVCETIPDNLIGDASRLRQILENFVSNAIKFTPRGKVSVSVSKNEHSAAADWVSLLFIIADTGIGIPEKYQETIFETFGQGNAFVHAHYGGSGLGLSICKHYVELMGGTICFTSLEEQGSTFYFTLRFALDRSESAEASSLSKAGKNQPSLRILVAEDSRMNRIYTAEKLQSNGHDVVTVKDGYGVLRALAREIFDLVLMDLRMPNLDGLKTLQVIRQDPPEGIDPFIPVIALTAHCLQEDIQRIQGMGFDGHLLKPLDMNSFEQALTRIGQLPR